MDSTRVQEGRDKCCWSRDQHGKKWALGKVRVFVLLSLMELHKLLPSTLLPA